MVDIQGNFIPLATPFTDDTTSISEVRLARLLKRLAAPGGLVVAGDVGEFASLSPAERKELLEMVLRLAPGVPVAANVTSDSTTRSLDLAQHASRHGARAVLIMPPRYHTLSPREALQHFHTVAKHAQVGVIVVDPHRTLAAEVLQALESLPDLNVAPSGSWSDTWVIGRASCSSGALMRALGQPVREAEWNNLLERYGRAQVVKSAMEQMGVEAGPPRAPARPLVAEGLERLAAALA